MDKIAASIAKIAAEAVLKANAEARAQMVDLAPPVLDGLRAWVAAQPDPKPTLQEAVDRGLRAWLAGQGYLSPGGEGAAGDERGDG